MRFFRLWYIPALALLLLAPALLSSETAQPLNEAYKNVASRIVAAAMSDPDGYAKLSYLCERIGHRLSGSAGLEKAVEWTAAQMKKDGLENVVTPAVKTPHWVRGRESATIIAPLERPLRMLGLGGSVGTPPEGVTAEVLPVASFEELERLGKEKVAGKIVLFNVPWAGYFKTVQYRSSGPSRAAALGAVGMLMRSAGPPPLEMPHTGALSYSAAAPKIPAAAITLEDAGLLQRLADSGKVTVRLLMEAQMLPEADSANVIGEIKGREKPEEVVVIGGHLDSWDVGQGAHDDGGGSIASLQAAALLKKLGLRPRRTLRVVLFTNEENGLAGGRAYRSYIGDAVKNHVAAIEMDGGAEKPVGFGVTIPPRAADNAAQARGLARAKEIGRLLESIGAGSVEPGGGGADIGPLMREGVPGLGLRTVGARYFDWHHTNGDTVDKIKPEEFRQNVAAMAVMAYVLADMPERLSE